MAQNSNDLTLKRVKENGNVFLALFGAVAIVGVIGGTAAGIMKGPMKVMSDVSSRAVAENEIMANTKMGVMSVAQATTKDCDNDGTVEPYPYIDIGSATTQVGPAPTGGGYLPSEVETTRWFDPWGNSYTYCVWDHGVLIDDATCGGAGQNRLPGLNTTTYPASSVNEHVSIAVLSAGPNRVYETTCQDWATADGNADGLLTPKNVASGDTPLINKPVGSDDIVMSYSYAEAAMATSSNWRIQSGVTTTAEITEDEVEIGGQTADGDGVSTTISGAVSTAGLKLAADPGDDSITGACNAANDQAIRVNTGGSTKALEICTGGVWTPVSGSSTSNTCEITSLAIAGGGTAWVQDGSKLNGASAIRIRGNYAYVATGGTDGLTVLDISDPLNPVIANSGNAWLSDAAKMSGAHDIDIQGDYAYISSSTSNSLTVIDISDPLNPVIANGGNAWVQDATKLNRAYGVEVEGNYAYVVTFDGNSLTVVDISDPLNPVIANGGNAWVQDNTLLQYADGIDIDGDYAYVAAYGDHLVVVDISDPLNPVIANGGTAFVQSSTRLDGARDVEVRGNYAYVAVDRDNNFTVVDISDPLNPFIPNGGNAWVQDATKLGAASNLTLTGNYALVRATASNALTAIDISDPLNPVIANGGNAWAQDPSRLYNSGQVVVAGQYAYTTVGASNAVTVVDLGCDPEGYYGLTGTNIGFNPAAANCVEGDNGPFIELDHIDLSRSRGVWSDGTYTYIADVNDGLLAFTFDGTTLTQVGSVDPPGDQHGVWGDGTYIYTANDNSGISAYTFDGTTFTQAGTLGLGGQAQRIWGDGTHIYLANDGSGLRALSFDGTTFTLIDTYSSSGNTYGVWGDGTYIYMADYAGGVRALTFDGTTFAEIASFNSPNTATGIWGDGDYLYVGDMTSGLRALSFDGHNFTEVGIVNTVVDARHIWGDGINIYLSDGADGLRAYTFDGHDFTEVSAVNPGSIIRDLWGDGTHIYVANWTSGIRVFSGFECRKAGERTLGAALQYDYTTGQMFEVTSDGDGSAESYGTALLLKSAEFGDEVGFAVNVSSAPTADDITSSAITATRTGINGEGALLFKTQDSDGNLNTNMMIDSDGDLGIGTSAPFNVSAKIQISDLASDDLNSFQPYAANCDVNENGPWVTAGSTDTPGNGANIFLEDGYIYLADGTVGGLRAYTFDGTTFTEEAFIIPGVDTYDVWSDGTYIYTSNLAGGIIAYTFDGTTFTQVGTQAAGDRTFDIWGDGTYIYAADDDAGIKAYTFDGTTFTEVGSYDITSGGFESVWGDGAYLYVTVRSGNPYELMVMTFDGTDFTLVAGMQMPHTARDVMGDGEYLYVAVQASGVAVVDFDGTNLTLLDQRDISETGSVWTDGVYVYGGAGNSYIRAMSFIDNELSTVANTASTSGQSGDAVAGDGTYVYATNHSGGYLTAYSGFGCTKASGWQGPTEGLLAGNGTDGNGPFVQLESLTEGGYRQDVEYIDDYIFFPQNGGGMKIFRPYKDGLLQSIGTFPTTDHVGEMWTDGTYLYTAEGNGGMRIYTFDGSNLTELAFYIGSKAIEAVWGDGTYIYSNERDALRAHTWDGTTLTYINFIGTANGGNIWGDGTYIYQDQHSSSSSSNLRAFSFDGANFTLHHTLARSCARGDLYHDGNYLYATSSAACGMSAYTFNGTAFTETVVQTATGRPSAFWQNDDYVFAQVGGTPDETYDLFAFTYDGTTFNKVDSISNRSYSITGDGNYIYTATEGGRINIFGGFTSRPKSIAYFGNDGAGDVDTNILYSERFKIKSTNTAGTTTSDLMSVSGLGTTTFKQGTIDLVDEAGAFEFLTNLDLFQYQTVDQDVSPSVVLRRSKGDETAPLEVTTGDILGALTWAGYDGTSIAANGNAAIYAKVTETYANNILPTGIFFSTDNAGNALGSSDLSILPTGHIGIGTEAALEELHVAGRIAMSEGLRLGYDNNCNIRHDKGFVRYTTDNAVEYCTAKEWISITEAIPQNPFDPEAYNCVVNNGGPYNLVTSTTAVTNTTGVWSDGEYIYTADDTGGIRAYGFDGTTLTEIDTAPTPFANRSLWGDGTYIYVANNADGIRAFTFDGTTLTEVGHLDTAGFTEYVWGDGAYIYAADRTNGLLALTFNGSTFTQHGIYNTVTDIYGAWSDGTYIYVAANSDGIRALTFDGTTFTEVATWTIADSRGLWGDGTYIYSAMGGDGVGAYTFDGTTLTQVGWIGGLSWGIDSVWTDGVYIYNVEGGDGIRAFSFDGATFTVVDTIDTPDWANETWGDGDFIYVADGSSLRVYSGFECTEVAEENNDDLINFNNIERTGLKITASDGASNDKFGLEVDIDGQYAIVSARDDDASTGSAYIFDIATGTELFKLTASDAASGDEFSKDIKINGNYAIVGALLNDDHGSSSGSAYIFDVSTGTELFKLTASDAAGIDFFGLSVAINGKYAAVGSPGNDDHGSGSGSVYIFDVTTGTELFKLTASDAASGDEFGYSIDISGKYIVIGARYGDGNVINSGAAYIFDIATGTELFKLTADDGAADDRFGFKVSIDNNYAVIGARYDDDLGDASGSAYVFDVTTGTQIHKLVPNDGSANDNFGHGIDLSGKYAAIASRLDDDNGGSSGSAYIFDITAGTQLEKIVEDGTGGGDLFGHGLAINGNTIISGSPQDDDVASNAGAAYIYQGNWTDRHIASAECYPDDLAFNSAVEITANQTFTTNTVTITGHVKDCVLSVSSDSNTIDIDKNGTPVGAPYVAVNTGDTIAIDIQASSTSGTILNNIVTLGDKRALFTVQTTPQ